MTVFHFTDTARLPWILATGELRPGRNAIWDFPSADFLWATTDARGDRTASVDRKALRKGFTREVRFTLTVCGVMTAAFLKFAGACRRR
jgi:hypothetical protein